MRARRAREVVPVRRRGEISMEVIIIAAVALLVLVILSVLLIRSGVGFGQGSGCEGVGGQCFPDSCADQLDDQGRPLVRSFNACSQDGYVCCVPIGKSDQEP